jgi:hypothetical protein
MAASTEKMVSATRSKAGRKRVNHEQAPLRLPEGTLARVDAVLASGEKRADLFRTAIERELQCREP